MSGMSVARTFRLHSSSLPFSGSWGFGKPAVHQPYLSQAMSGQLGHGVKQQGARNRREITRPPASHLRNLG
jgi:hypothetical protein